MDLFGAGSETTSTTLRWALLFMVLNPTVQVIVLKSLLPALSSPLKTGYENFMWDCVRPRDNIKF